MKWTVKEWFTCGYQARKAGTPNAYIYRSLKWPDFYSDGAPAYEVKYGDHRPYTLRGQGRHGKVPARGGALPGDNGPGPGGDSALGEQTEDGLFKP